jgi:hypothetical protein
MGWAQLLKSYMNTENLALYGYDSTCLVSAERKFSEVIDNACQAKLHQ